MVDRIVMRIVMASVHTHWSSDAPGNVSILLQTKEDATLLPSIDAARSVIESITAKIKRPSLENMADIKLGGDIVGENVGDSLGKAVGSLVGLDVGR